MAAIDRRMKSSVIGATVSEVATLPECARVSSRAARNRKECGSSLVEMALILMFLLTVLFGIMGFGQALYTYHFLNNSAKEATRWAAVNGATCNTDSSCNGMGYMNNGPATLANVQTYVTNLTPPGVDSTKVSVFSTTSTTSTTPSTCGLADTGACPQSTPRFCSQLVTNGTTSIGPSPDYPGCTVQVTVTYPYQFTFGLLNSIIPTATATTAPCTSPGICLSSTSDMIIAH